MWRLKALCEAYDLRPTRMCLVGEMRKVAVERSTGRSPFPSSLSCLSFAPIPLSTDADSQPRGMFGSEAAKVDSIQCLWAHPRTEVLDEHYRQLLFDETTAVHSFEQTKSLSRFQLSAGLLPHGLRRLQLPTDFNSPLQVRDIPSTVEVLHFGTDYHQPLKIGVLPSSLVHLVLDSVFDYPLVPHVLPASLQRLDTFMWNQPLTVAGVPVLPSSLKALQMHSFNYPIEPGALPSGLTHLVVKMFNQPLKVGSLPPSLVSLDLGYLFSQPLEGVLPSSLRVLVHSTMNRHPLIPGVLPEGLAVLHLRLSAYGDHNPIFPGALPLSLRALDMGAHWLGNFMPGTIPDSLRWLRLRVEKAALRTIPASVQVEWEPEDDRV